MEDDEEDIFMTDVHEEYAGRPETPGRLNNVLEFVVAYETLGNSGGGAVKLIVSITSLMMALLKMFLLKMK